jgi:hypothetical protein
LPDVRHHSSLSARRAGRKSCGEIRFACWNLLETRGVQDLVVGLTLWREDLETSGDDFRRIGMPTNRFNGFSTRGVRVFPWQGVIAGVLREFGR